MKSAFHDTCHKSAARQKHKDVRLTQTIHKKKNIPPQGQGQMPGASPSMVLEYLGIRPSTIKFDRKIEICPSYSNVHSPTATHATPWSTGAKHLFLRKHKERQADLGTIPLQHTMRRGSPVPGRSTSRRVAKLFQERQEYRGSSVRGQSAYRRTATPALFRGASS